MIKTIIFDLGKVIVPFDFQRGYRRLEALCALPAATIPPRIRATGLVPRFETGLVEPRDFVAQLGQALDTRLDYEQFREIWSSIFLDHTYIPEAMLAGLRKRYRLVLLSNTNVIHFEMLRERLPHLRHFDEWVLSYEVKCMKPDRRIFEHAVAAARCLPEECFFTDDIAEYITAARDFGIDAVQFQSLEQTQAALRARGVSWE